MTGVRSHQQPQGLLDEHRGKPYAGNPHVRFDEGLLVRASRTADWGLLDRISKTHDRLTADAGDHSMSDQR
jgi:hypothetical protein